MSFRALPVNQSPAARRIGLALLCLMAWLSFAALPASATVSVQPTSVEVFPTETSDTIQVRVQFPPRTFAGHDTLTTQLPGPLAGNTSVMPSQPSYSWSVGDSSAVATLRIATTTATPPGTWQIQVSGGPNLGLAAIQLVVRRPGFDVRLTPGRLQLEAGDRSRIEVRTTADPGLADVTYQAEGFPSFLDFGNARVASAPAFAPVGLSVSVAADAEPGVYRGGIRGSSPGADSVLARLTVELIAPPPPSPPPPAPRFTGNLASAQVDLRVGGEGRRLIVRTRGEPGLGDVTYAIEGLPSFVRTLGAEVSTSPAFPDVSLPLELRSGARPGAYQGLVVGRAAGAPEVRLPFTVEVSPARAPGFRAALVPKQVQITVGEDAEIVVRTQGEPGLGDVTYRVEGLPSFLAISGPKIGTARAPRFGDVTLRLSADGRAVPGTYQALVRGSAAGARAVEMPLPIQVSPPLPRVLPPPRIERLAPARVTRGSTGETLEIFGSGFQAGARLEVDGLASGAGLRADVRLGDPRILSDGRIVSTLAIRSSSDGAVVRLRVVNPDGQTSNAMPLVLVGRSDLSAPLAVRQAAVVFPSAGALVARDDEVRPRGVLATSGSGTIIGSWRLDGVVFDRFVVQARAGEPVDVEARVPVPVSFLGEHELVLAVESPEAPETVASRPVSIVVVASKAEGFRLLTPPDGEAVGPSTPPTFRWAPSPGAHGYLVELLSADGEVLASQVAAETSWTPDPETWTGLPAGEVVWRVRPRYVGGGLGEAALGYFLLTDGVLADREARRETAWNVRPAAWSARQTPAFRLASTADVDEQIEGLDGFGGGSDEPSSWQVDLEGTISGSDDGSVEAASESEAYVALSASVNQFRETSALQITAEGAARWNSEDEEVDGSENRSWVALGSMGAEPGSGGWRGSLALGHQGPTFLVDSEILSVGLPTEGFELGASRGSLSLGYHETTSGPAGALGTGVGEPKSRALALIYGGSDAGESGGGMRVALMGVEASRPDDEFTVGADSDLLGLSADWRSAAGVRWTAEAAWSETHQSVQSVGSEMEEGGAYRVSLEQDTGDLTYGVNLFYTDPEFENPVNEGFTLGGRPGVASAEARLGRRWASSSADLTYEYLENVEQPESFVSASRQHALQVSWERRWGVGLSLELGGEAGMLRSEGDEDLFFAGSDQESWGLTAALSSQIGRWSLRPDLSLRRVEDRLDAERNSNVMGLGLAVFGGIGLGFTFSSHLSAISEESGADRDENDTMLVSLEPAWTFGASGFSLRTHGSYQRIDSPFQLEPLESETYRLLVSWDRDWTSSSAAFELGGEWSRTSGGFFSSDDGFVARCTASVTLRWNWNNTPRSSRSFGGSGTGPDAGMDLGLPTA